MQPRHLPYHARRVELPQAGFRLFVRPGLKSAPKKSLSQALRRAVSNLVICGTRFEVQHLPLQHPYSRCENGRAVEPIFGTPGD